MPSINLSSYTHSDLQNILRVVRDYKTARKQIGNRAVLRDPRVESKKLFRVVYSKNIDLDRLKDNFQKFFQAYFPEESADDLIYQMDMNLVGGIRLFHGDDFLDITFENFIQKV